MHIYRHATCMNNTHPKQQSDCVFCLIYLIVTSYISWYISCTRITIISNVDLCYIVWILFIYVEEISLQFCLFSLFYFIYVCTYIEIHYILSFFRSWFSKTQPNHWPQRVYAVSFNPRPPSLFCSNTRTSSPSSSSSLSFFQVDCDFESWDVASPFVGSWMINSPLIETKQAHSSVCCWKMPKESTRCYIHIVRRGYVLSSQWCFVVQCLPRLP